MKNQEAGIKKQGKYTIFHLDANKRLDVFLTEKLNITRSAVQKMISRGEVILNGERPSKTGYKVVSGDIITVSDPQPLTSHLSPTTASGPRPRTCGASPSAGRGGVPLCGITSHPPLKILCETAEYFVIDKPAGLIVHEAPSKEQTTLVDLLLEKYPELKGIGDDPLRPGIVHRLDKDASGIMVVAKTQESFDSLKRQFKLRRVEKEYLILVHGHVEPAEGTIDLPIARAASHSTKFVGTTAGGRQAVTNYKVEQYLNEYSLVRVIPETGRTHQIRVHFFSRGYPLVGDKIYRSKKRVSRKSPGEGGRLMLHACSLEFRDLSDAVQRYDCPPGHDFQDVLVILAKIR